jgi:hypothetical protein
MPITKIKVYVISSEPFFLLLREKRLSMKLRLGQIIIRKHNMLSHFNKHVMCKWRIRTISSENLQACKFQSALERRGTRTGREGGCPAGPAVAAPAAQPIHRPRSLGPHQIRRGGAPQ